MYEQEQIRQLKAEIAVLRKCVMYYASQTFQEGVDDSETKFDEAKKAMVVRPGRYARQVLENLAKS